MFESPPPRDAAPAPIDALQLDGARSLRVESKLLTVGATFTVFNERGDHLLTIRRPTGEAVKSEIINILLDRDSKSERRWNRRLNRPDSGDIKEHHLARNYDFWTTDERWAGRLHKGPGHFDAQWAFQLTDGMPGVYFQVFSDGAGLLGARMLDLNGQLALFVQGYGRTPHVPIMDPGGAQVALVEGRGRSFSAGYTLELSSDVHALYPLLLSIIVAYEANPGQ